MIIHYLVAQPASAFYRVHCGARTGMSRGTLRELVHTSEWAEVTCKRCITMMGV